MPQLIQIAERCDFLLRLRAWPAHHTRGSGYIRFLPIAIHCRARSNGQHQWQTKRTVALLSASARSRLVFSSWQRPRGTIRRKRGPLCITRGPLMGDTSSQLPSRRCSVLRVPHTHATTREVVSAEHRWCTKSPSRGSKGCGRCVWGGRMGG